MTKEEFIKKCQNPTDNYFRDDFIKDLDSLLQPPAIAVSDDIPDEQIDYLLKDQMALPHYINYQSLAPTMKATYDYGKRIAEFVRSKMKGRKQGWVSVKVEYKDHKFLILTNEKGDTYTATREGLMDFFHGLPAAPETEGGEG